MDTEIAISLIVSCFFLFLYFILKPSKPLNLPPRPRKLPLIGNVHQLAGKLPHRAFRDLARKHGPIMHIQLGQISAVIISSPRLAEEVLKPNDIALADRPTTFGSELVLYGNTDIALALYEQELNGFMELLRLSSGKPIDIQKTVTEVINNVVCIASFGKNCKQQHALLDFLDEFARVNTGFYVADLFPDFKFLYVVSGHRSRLMKLYKTLDKIFDDIWEEHEGGIKDHGGDQEEDLLEVLLRIKEEGGLGIEDILRYKKKNVKKKEYTAIVAAREPVQTFIQVPTVNGTFKLTFWKMG
ncbi:hypothetical protein LXL04_033669 [Taraxacum kok-saghyz]